MVEGVSRFHHNLAMALPLIPLLFGMTLLGCGERPEAHYAHYLDAVASGAVSRGWIPSWLPTDSTNIREIHDLDTNSSVLAFQFKAPFSPPPHCKQVGASALAQPPFRPKWWPNDVPPTSLQTYRHTYYACDDGAFLAVSPKLGEGFYWRP